MDVLDLKVGFKCNNSCIHCVIQRTYKIKEGKELDWKKEILGWKACKGSCVNITGGEPTLNKDLIDICLLAKKEGYKVSIQTNGRLLSDEVLAEKICKTTDQLVIALHGPNSEVHDSITRKKGSFEQTLKGIKNAQRNGINPLIKIVLSKLNYKELKNIMVFLAGLGIRSVRISFPHGLGEAWLNKEKVMPSYNNIKIYINDLIGFVKKFNEKNIADQRISMIFEAIPFCITGKDKDFFLERYPKNIITVNKFSKTENFTKIMKNESRIKFDDCEKCFFDNVCYGPWREYVELFGTEEFSPVRSLKHLK